MHNYFELLGLEPSFALVESDLEQRYIRAQQDTHPDKMIARTAPERAAAIQRSMDINAAYDTLKSPLTRAQHLLALQNIHVNTENDTIKPPQTLLMEVMEIREQLQSIETPEQLQQAHKDIKKACNICTAQLQTAFDAPDYNHAAELTIRLRYLGKLLEEATMRQYQMMRAFE